MVPRRSIPKDDKTEQEEAALLLLDAWRKHDSLDFHYFTPTEARRLRQALLAWYTVHRRKLPWRGDAPPWEGSTVDFGKKQQAKTKTASRQPQSQKTMKDFFDVTPPKTSSTSSSPRADDAPQSCPSSADDAGLPTFPVTPYGVWVSEVMLQQTRVEAVIPYWVRWMQAFPTVAHLAAASEDQVNAHFTGLGFYRRARLLHQACQLLVKEHEDGAMPTTVEGLLELPGIGRYTASAIASIAYGVPVPVVDGNVCRVLARLRGIANHVKAPALKDKYGWELAQQLVVDDDGESHPGDLNQALMELGATYCAPSGSGTDPQDPLVEFYWSTQLGHAYAVHKQKDTIATFTQVVSASGGGCPICASDSVYQTLASLNTLLDSRLSSTKESFSNVAKQCGHAAFPLAPPKQARREQVLAVAVLSKEDGRYLMVKRPKTGLLAGQWEFPAACVWSSEGKTTDGQIAKIAPTERRKALDGLVAQIFTDDSQTKLVPQSLWQKRSLVEEPLEHIFSHVRHTMWLEEKSMGTKKHDTRLAWTDSTDREVRWMNQNDMKEVGITSGVKKVLKIVVARQKVKPIKRQRTK